MDDLVFRFCKQDADDSPVKSLPLPTSVGKCWNAAKGEGPDDGGGA